MGFSYRKRVKLMPGVNINISKKGASVTVGTRGASVNIGKSGIYQNLGIPGTGIYSREKISGNDSVKSDQSKLKTKEAKSPVSERYKKDYSSVYLSVLYALVIILVIGIILSYIVNN